MKIRVGIIAYLLFCSVVVAVAVRAGSGHDHCRECRLARGIHEEK